MLKFGNARLYRNGRDSYRIGIFGAPKTAVLDDGTHIYHIGFYDAASVHVKELTELNDGPIFEFEEGAEEMVAESFEQWLTSSCAGIKSTYRKKQWEDILRGPKPFTAEEAEIVKMRRSIRWAMLGIDAERNHIFEVMNQVTVSYQLSRSGSGRKTGGLTAQFA